VYARPVQREDNISRPTQSLKRFLQVAAVIKCALYASSFSDRRWFYIFSDYCCAAFCRCPSDHIL